MTKRAGSDLTLGELLGDVRVLLIAFISLRALLFIAYPPLFIEGAERGLTTGGDFFTYYLLGGFVGQGLLPFRDWWSEFPPIPAVLLSLVFIFTDRAGYPGFALVFGVIMIACDVGNLLLVRSIGRKLYGANTGMALAWIYALMLAPLVFMAWNFEPMVAFFLLLGLNALIGRRDARSAVWAGIGALIKFTPALLLGVVWRWRSARAALRYTLIVLAVFGVVYVPLLIASPAMTLPSLTAQFNKASYQTVWALIDQNYRTGNFGPLNERFDPASAARAIGNPAVIPGWVRLIGAAAIGLFVFARARRFDDRGLVAFVLITLLIFFLQAQGWSPQWLAQIVPLLLLCFPTRQGVLIAVLLSAVTFIEYPFLWLRTGNTGGVMPPRLLPAYTILIVVRTLILIGVCIALYRRLRQTPLALPDGAAR